MYWGIALLFVSLFFLSLASYTDLKRREVADEVSVGFLTASLAIRLAWSASSGDPSVFIDPFLVSLGFLAFSLAMYYSKQWGGGDLLILTSLGVAFGTLPSEFSRGNSILPFWASLLANIFIFGAAYGVVWIFSLIAMNRQVRVEALGKALKYWYFTAPLFALAAFSALFLNDLVGKLVGIALFVLYLAFLASRAVEGIIFTRNVRPQDLRVEDWLAENVCSRGRVVVKVSSTGLTKTDIQAIELLASKGLLDKKQVSIREGIPFVPVFLISLVGTIAVGDPLLTFLNLFGVPILP